MSELSVRGRGKDFLIPLIFKMKWNQQGENHCLSESIKSWWLHCLELTVMSSQRGAWGGDAAWSSRSVIICQPVYYLGAFFNEVPSLADSSSFVVLALSFSLSISFSNIHCCCSRLWSHSITPFCSLFNSHLFSFSLSFFLSSLFISLCINLSRP